MHSVQVAAARGDPGHVVLLRCDSPWLSSDGLSCSASRFLLVTATGALAATGWQAPLRPLTVTRPFEPPPTPYAAGHRGVDLAVSLASECWLRRRASSASPGTLAGGAWLSSSMARCAPPTNRYWRSCGVGAQVTGGEQIGVLQPGHPGCPAAACLHWGLLRGDTYLDPLGMLGARTGAAPAAAEDVQPASPGASRGAPLEAAVLPAPGLNPGVSWSVAGVAGAGVVMLRRRR